MAAYVIEKIDRICDAAPIFDLKFSAPDIAAMAKPGQIVHVICGGDANSLRRPISICECEGDLVRICFEVRGAGTKELAARRAGDSIDVICPYGKGFPELKVKVALVGGGL